MGGEPQPEGMVGTLEAEEDGEGVLALNARAVPEGCAEGRSVCVAQGVALVEGGTEENWEDSVVEADKVLAAVLSEAVDEVLAEGRARCVREEEEEERLLELEAVGDREMRGVAVLVLLTVEDLLTGAEPAGDRPAVSETLPHWLKDMVGLMASERKGQAEAEKVFDTEADLVATVYAKNPCVGGAVHVVEVVEEAVRDTEAQPEGPRLSPVAKVVEEVPLTDTVTVTVAVLDTGTVTKEDGDLLAVAEAVSKMVPDGVSEAEAEGAAVRMVTPILVKAVRNEEVSVKAPVPLEQTVALGDLLVVPDLLLVCEWVGTENEVWEAVGELPELTARSPVK